MLGNLRDLWAFYRKCLKVWKSKSRSFDSHPIDEDLSPGDPGLAALAQEDKASYCLKRLEGSSEKIWPSRIWTTRCA
jgi:hypothetical protein